MYSKSYYKSCGGNILGSEEQKISRLDQFEKSGKWIAESKNDGIWFVLINTDGVTIGYTRRGNKKEHNLPEIDKGTILIGELSESTEKAIERKKIIGHNFMDVFDIHTYKGTNVCDLPLMERKAILKQWHDSLSEHDKEYYLYCPAHEHDFKELYHNESEGIVLKSRDGKYNSLSWDWLKVKKERTYDMIIMSYVLSNAESKSYIPTAKSFICGQYYNGVLKPMVKVPVSTDIGIKAVENFSLYENKVIEVKGFCRTKTGSVRSPIFMRFRDDKNLKDCVFDLQQL